MSTIFQVVATKDLPKAIGEGFSVFPISRNDGKKGKSGLVAVMPSISESVSAVFLNDPVGKAFVVDALASLRSKVASALHAKGKDITSETIGIDALLALAKAETESQRMTKEAIGIWFDADLSQYIDQRIREKLAGIAQDKLDKLVLGYRERFQTLSMREVNMPLEVKAQLVKAMELLPEDYESIIGEKVAAALAKAEEASESLMAL